MFKNNVRKIFKNAFKVRFSKDIHIGDIVKIKRDVNTSSMFGDNDVICAGQIAMVTDSNVRDTTYLTGLIPNLEISYNKGNRVLLDKFNAGKDLEILKKYESLTEEEIMRYSNECLKKIF